MKKNKIKYPPRKILVNEDTINDIVKYYTGCTVNTVLFLLTRWFGDNFLNGASDDIVESLNGIIKRAEISKDNLMSYDHKKQKGFLWDRSKAK